jgi:peptidoglycan hydrolase-like protein with peptidoglycan-binding domain
MSEPLDDDATEQERSWPFVALGAVIALILGGIVWFVWLSPGGPTVDTPVRATPSSTPTATSTAESMPTPSATPRMSRVPVRTTPRATASLTPTGPPDQPNNPINDAIVGYPGTPLSRTSKNPTDVVLTVQQRLVDLGYSVAVNGTFDRRTEAAVKKFQQENSLPVTGIVGRATWAALFTSEGG